MVSKHQLLRVFPVKPTLSDANTPLGERGFPDRKPQALGSGLHTQGGWKVGVGCLESWKGVCGVSCALASSLQHMTSRRGSMSKEGQGHRHPSSRGDWSAPTLHCTLCSTLWAPVHTHAWVRRGWVSWGVELL